MGVVLLFDPVEGVPIALIDAAAITALRTAAATAVATRALARSAVANMAVLGTGEQAAAHMHAICAVRELRSIRVWGRSEEKARALANRESAALGIDVIVSTSIEEAVADAGIVCTTTSARQPILQGQWIEPGTHVNLVGASSAEAREADEALVRKSRYFVDFRPSALAQAGELFATFGRGSRQAEEFICAEIGEVLNETKPGRTGDEEVTIYKSLGIAAQDLAVSHAVYRRAREAGLGTWASI
jgi:ornithine cyclodeaminase